MSDTTSARNGRRWARLAWGRLRHNRALIAAAVVAILAVHVVGEGSNLFLLAVVAALLLVAVATPRRLTDRRVPVAAGTQDPQSGLAGLSVEGLAAAVDAPLLVSDAGGIVVHANAAALAAFPGVEPGMALALKFRAPEMQELIERLLSRKEPAAADYFERVPVERHFRVSGSAVAGTDLFVLTFKDQSEARRIDRMRADFIANASHELRTPLASISGFIETLRGPARDDPRARERFLEIMHGQTGRMARLIDDLLSLSRLEMKAGVAREARVDLVAVVRSVIEALKPLAAENGVAIEDGLGAGAVMVAGERDELYQVFENLLENACKYGRSGGRVVVSPAQGEVGEAAITVRDFGPGIAAEHIPRITERFYRVDVGSGPARKGTGLGLAIVKHIVGRHGGRLLIRSGPGEGAAFTVSLPAA